MSLTRYIFNLRCNIGNCTYAAVELYRLQRHTFNVHQDIKPLKCPKCDYRCKTGWTLKNHLTTHTNKRPFPCLDGCGKRFKTSHALNAHQLVHTDERPFGCDSCIYAAKDKESLKNHVRNFHDPSKDPKQKSRYQMKSK